MVLALARPQWGTERTDILTEGVNIALAVDISESMSALDFRSEGNIVNRLDAAKGVIQDFIETRSGDRIAIVVFGTHAYTQLPLSRDYDTVATVLQRLEIGTAGKRTAIGDAIGISLKRLKDIPGKSNLIILLTDGESNSGELSPETAAEIARKQNVKIYTVGIGSRGKAPFRIQTVLGERIVYQRVNIDEKTLKEIAEKTGGLYFKAENVKGLKRIYETIDRMEKTEVKVKTYTRYREYYPYLLVPAFVLISLFIILKHTRFLSVP